MSEKLRLIIHAANVHHGGGRSLLIALLNNLPDNIDLRVTLDERLQFPEVRLQNFRVNRVSPSIVGRIKAERWLADTVEPGDLVLCFGNLPPLFRLAGRVLVFVQNRYLVDDVRLDSFPFRIRLRLGMERLWFNRRIARVDEIIVQSPSMKVLLENRIGSKIPVNVVPFVGESEGYDRNGAESRPSEGPAFDFLYVASGDPHKNHRQLVMAWRLLAEEGRFPSLRLTIDERHYSELCAWISRQSRQCRLDIENFGNLGDTQIRELYTQAGALIYPSILESLGLPLIEARQAGLPVLASELDYVRDLLDPDESFDPASKVSIARAVKRFIGITEESAPLLDAPEFVDYVCRQFR